MPKSTLSGPSWEPGREPDGWVPPEPEPEPEAPAPAPEPEPVPEPEPEPEPVPEPEPEPAPAPAPKAAPVRPRGKDEITGSGGAALPKPAAGDGG